jgi:hypothetical protein
MHLRHERETCQWVACREEEVNLINKQCNEAKGRERHCYVMQQRE